MSMWCEHCRGHYPTDHYGPGDDDGHRTGPEFGPYGHLLAEAEAAERLRELLIKLEWAGTTCWQDGSEEEICPVCGSTQEEGHLAARTLTGPDGKPYTYSGCWLAGELRR